MQFHAEGLEIPYSVRRSRDASRPRIDFRQGVFTVVLPQGIGLDAEAVLENHEAWVIEKYQGHQEFCEKVPERSLRDGGTVKLLGEEKNIVVEKRRSSKVSDNILLAGYMVERNGVKKELEKALRSEIREIVEEKLETYQEEISGEFNKVFIRDQRTRWGSCSTKNNLNFNWRLILGPEHVLDYVIIHELVHLEHKNHGKAFWNQVGEILPDYRESKKWLKENRHQLVWDIEKSA